MKLFLKILTFLLFACMGSLGQSSVQFQLAAPNFGITQTTNATVTVQAENIYYAGQITLLPLRLTQITDMTGQTTFTNLFGSTNGGFYHWTVSIYNSSQRVSGDMWVQSTNLGTIPEGLIDIVNGVPTYPAGSWSWSAYAADMRYALSTNNIALYATLVYLTSVSNAVTAQFPNLTNGFASTNQVNQFGLNNTNYTLQIAGNVSNSITADGGASTNFVLTVANNNTNFTLLAGQANTNLSLAVGMGATNLALAIGNNDTNQSLLIGSQVTNYTRAIGLNNTNFSLTIGQNATNQAAVVSNGIVTASQYANAMTNNQTVVQFGQVGMSGWGWVTNSQGTSFFTNTSGAAAIVVRTNASGPLATVAMTNETLTVSNLQALGNATVVGAVSGGTMASGGVITSAGNATFGANLSSGNNVEDSSGNFDLTGNGIIGGGLTVMGNLTNTGGSFYGGIINGTGSGLTGIPINGVTSLAAELANGTNYSLSVGQNNTNFSLSLGSNGTNLSLSLGLSSTNYSNGIGTAGTNYANGIGAAATNLVNAIGQLLTNYANGIGSSATNYANSIGSAATNLVTQATNEISIASGNLAYRATNSVDTNGAALYFAGLGSNNVTASGLLITNFINNTVDKINTNYVVMTNGTAVSLNVLNAFIFGTKTNLLADTNLIGVIGQFGGTYLGAAGSLSLTNIQNSNNIVTASGSSFYLLTNGTAVVQWSSTLGAGTAVPPGTSPAPYADFGADYDFNGNRFRGSVYSTNLTAQMQFWANQYATNAIMEDVIAGYGLLSVATSGQNMLSVNTNGVIASQFYVQQQIAGIGGATNGVTSNQVVAIIALQPTIINALTNAIYTNNYGIPYSGNTVFLYTNTGSGGGGVASNAIPFLNGSGTNTTLHTFVNLQGTNETVQSLTFSNFTFWGNSANQNLALTMGGFPFFQLGGHAGTTGHFLLGSTNNQFGDDSGNDLGVGYVGGNFNNIQDFSANHQNSLYIYGGWNDEIIQLGIGSPSSTGFTNSDILGSFESQIDLTSGSSPATLQAGDNHIYGSMYSSIENPIGGPVFYDDMVLLGSNSIVENSAAEVNILDSLAIGRNVTDTNSDTVIVNAGGTPVQTYADGSIYLNADNGIYANGTRVDTGASSTTYFNYLWVTNCTGSATNMNGLYTPATMYIYTNSHGCQLLSPGNYTVPTNLLITCTGVGWQVGGFYSLVTNACDANNTGPFYGGASLLGPYNQNFGNGPGGMTNGPIVGISTIIVQSNPAKTTTVTSSNGQLTVSSTTSAGAINYDIGIPWAPSPATNIINFDSSYNPSIFGTIGWINASNFFIGDNTANNITLNPANGTMTLGSDGGFTFSTGTGFYTFDGPGYIIGSGNGITSIPLASQNANFPQGSGTVILGMNGSTVVQLTNVLSNPVNTNTSAGYLTFVTNATSIAWFIGDSGSGLSNLVTLPATGLTNAVGELANGQLVPFSTFPSSGGSAPTYTSWFVGTNAGGAFVISNTVNSNVYAIIDTNTGTLTTSNLLASGNITAANSVIANGSFKSSSYQNSGGATLLQPSGGPAGGQETQIWDPLSSGFLDETFYGSTNTVMGPLIILGAGVSTATTNTLTVTLGGITNNTTFDYMLTITAGTALALKDGNGNQFAAPVLGDTVPLKPGWRFTGTAVTAQCYQFP